MGVMEQRFDEVELVRVPEQDERNPPAAEATSPSAATRSLRAPLVNRALAFLTDVSLFVAIALAMSPLLPLRAGVVDTLREEPGTSLALLGFLLLISLHYCVLSWMIWGRTVGASIFDLRVVADDGGPVDGKSALRRWAGSLLCILTGGIGFLPALTSSRRSLADRLSSTQVHRAALE